MGIRSLTKGIELDGRKQVTRDEVSNKESCENRYADMRTKCEENECLRFGCYLRE